MLKIKQFMAVGMGVLMLSTTGCSGGKTETSSNPPTSTPENTTSKSTKEYTLTDEQYEEIQNFALSEVTQYLQEEKDKVKAEVFEKDVTYSEMIPRGIYLMPENELLPGRKEVLCVFVGTIESDTPDKTMRSLSYIYPYTVTNVMLDKKGNIESMSSFQRDDMQLEYLADDIPYILEKKNIQSVTPVKEYPTKQFETLEDIPEDIIVQVDKEAKAELADMVADLKTKNVDVLATPKLHGAYIMTTTHHDVMDYGKILHQKSLVLIYEYPFSASMMPNGYSYYHKRFYYMLYDHNNELVDYKIRTHKETSHKKEEEESLIRSYGIDSDIEMQRVEIPAIIYN